MRTGRDVVDRRAARRRRVRLRHRAAGGRGLHHDAQVPPQHLPGRRRHAGPGAAQAASPASPSTSSTTSSSSPRKCARSWRSWAIRTFDEMIGRSRPARHSASGIEHWKAKGLDFSALFYQADVPAGRARIHMRGAGPRPRQGARPQADREGAAGARARRAGAHRAADPQRRPHRRRDAVGRGRQALRP